MGYEGSDMTINCGRCLDVLAMDGTPLQAWSMVTALFAHTGQSSRAVPESCGMERSGTDNNTSLAA